MRYALLIAALLSTAGAASSQQLPQPPAPGPQAPAAPQPSTTPATKTTDYTGTVDVGGQFTGTTGDEALYEQLRDQRSGLFSNIAVSRQTNAFWLDASARHIGYRDQRYALSYLRPKLNFDFNFQGQPLNYSYDTRTPYSGRGTR